MKPRLGMRVRPSAKLVANPAEWDGVIVKIVPPFGGDHGYVATWLEKKLNYGDDNCEHYAYCSDDQLGALLVELTQA